MGNRQKLASIREETRLGTIRRCMGGIVEQHDAGGHQDIEIGHNGSKRFPGRSANHEETETQQAYSTVRRVHSRGANLYYYWADEARVAVGVPARYLLEFKFRLLLMRNRLQGKDVTWNSPSWSTWPHKSQPEWLTWNRKTTSIVIWPRETFLLATTTSSRSPISV